MNLVLAVVYDSFKGEVWFSFFVKYTTYATSTHTDQTLPVDLIAVSKLLTWLGGDRWPWICCSRYQCKVDDYPGG